MWVYGVRKSCERWGEDISLVRCKFCDGKASSSAKFDDHQECGSQIAHMLHRGVEPE